MKLAEDTWAQVRSARLGPRCAWKVTCYRNSCEVRGKRGTSVSSPDQQSVVSRPGYFPEQQLCSRCLTE